MKGPVQPMLPPPPSSTKRGHLERQQTVPTPSSQTSSPATVMPSRTSPPAQQIPMRWLENDVEKQFCDGEIANLTSTASADKDAKSDNVRFLINIIHKNKLIEKLFNKLILIG